MKVFDSAMSAIAQAVINIAEGHTTIEAESMIHGQMIGLCRIVSEFQKGDPGSDCPCCGRSKGTEERLAAIVGIVRAAQRYVYQPKSRERSGLVVSVDRYERTFAKNDQCEMCGTVEPLSRVYGRDESGSHQTMVCAVCAPKVPR